MSLRSYVGLWMQKQHFVTSMTVQLKRIPSDSLIQNNSCASFFISPDPYQSIGMNATAAA